MFLAIENGDRQEIILSHAQSVPTKEIVQDMQHSNLHGFVTEVTYMFL
jgi:hypothetical protein